MFLALTLPSIFVALFVELFGLELLRFFTVFAY